MLLGALGLYKASPLLVSSASDPFVNLAGRLFWHNAVLPSAPGR